MTPGVEVAGLAALAALLVAVAIFIALRVHGTPEKRERRRRLAVNQQGRLGDALVTEITDSAIYYSYSIRGVQYTASQDISALREKMPADSDRILGVASLKYSSRNPANSILLCEDWSGLRVRGAGS